MFKFKYKKQKTTEEGQKFVDREVKKLPKILTSIFLVYIIIFLIIMIWYFCFKSTYYISTVKGSSMKPTINSGITSEDQSEDFVYVNTKKEAKHGDIVVIDTSTDPIIKRVIGMAGDKVSIVLCEDGYFHVLIEYAGSEEVVVLEEDYIKSYDEWKNIGYYTQTQYFEGYYYEAAFFNMFIESQEDLNSLYVIDGVYFFEVPENYYFCLGDNRSVSSDSRSKGVFREEKIKGVADIIVSGGSLDNGWLFGKKISSILGFYWSEIEEFFSR